MLTSHPLQIATSVLRVANPRRNPGGVLMTVALLGLAGVGAFVVWQHFADDGNVVPVERPLSGRVGRFAWEIERTWLSDPMRVHYKWSVYDGNEEIEYGDEVETDDAVAYAKVRSRIDAVIASHGGTP